MFFLDAASLVSSIVPKRALCSTVLECIGVTRTHTEHVVLGQVHTPLCVVDIDDVIYSIATVVRAAHPQLRKSLRKTLTVVGSVEHVVLVWIQLQSDTVLLSPDRITRCVIMRQLHPLVLGHTLFDQWNFFRVFVPCTGIHFVPKS